MNILKFFVPKDRVFFTLFESAGETIKEISLKLTEMVDEKDEEKRRVILKEIGNLEHKNDDITHKIFIELGRNFITPFDREDIHELALALDDICDYVYDSAKKITFYKVDPSDHGITNLAKMIHEGVVAVNEAVVELRNLKNTKKIIDCVIKINSAENKADEIFDQNIERLFDQEQDPKKIIKLREIYQTLEDATDKCEDVGNVIESIVIKYA